MHPSQAELNFFHTFGYIVFRQLFNPSETAWIREELDTVLQTHGKGKEHDGTKRTIIVPTIDHSERLCTLLDDDRICGIASAILGEDFNYASGDGNYYSGDTGWHGDPLVVALTWEDGVGQLHRGQFATWILSFWYAQCGFC